MHNKIEILCPGKNCPRCKRFIKYMENFIKKNQLNAELIIVSNLKEYLKFNTWILPSIYVNGHKVSRAYIPKEEDIFKYLNLENKRIKN